MYGRTSTDEQTQAAVIMSFCALTGAAPTVSFQLTTPSVQKTWSVWRGDASTTVDDARDTIRLQVLEVVGRHPGYDAEDVAEHLHLDFEMVSDLIAAMCTEGILAPV